MILEVLVGIIVILIVILYNKFAKVCYHWKNRRLPHRTGYPLIGNVWQHILRNKSMGEIIMEVGNEFKNEPLVGFYNFSKPVIIANHISYSETVMIKEFSSFMNRGDLMEMDDMRPLDKHLFGLGDLPWKGVRSKMSPVFTSGKLKGMLPQMDNIFEKTINNIDKNLGKSIEVKDIGQLFSACVRASCVFGQDVSDMNLSSTFMEKLENLTKFDLSRFIGFSIAMWFPKLGSKLNLSFFGSQNEGYFVDMLLKVFKERSENGIAKNDLIQTLMELKQTGKVEIKQWAKEDDYLKMDEKHMTTETFAIDDDILMAQSFIFLLAGLDTVITTDVLALVELSRNRQALEKLRKEVDEAINKYKEFSYDALKEMTYLDMCIKETMRKYPTVEFVGRHCKKSHTFENGFTVESGDHIFIPILKNHMDPTYFPEPTRFNPDRFENITLPPCVFLPFGEGPRICIGQRFATLEIKMFLSKMVYNYDFTLDPKTSLPVLSDNWFFLKRLVSPVYLTFNKRKH